MNKNQVLHLANKDYGIDGTGVTSDLHKGVRYLCEQKMIGSMLDYGAGKGLLIKKLKEELKGLIIEIDGYDPYSNERHLASIKRKGYDLVTCIDVLEHVEESDIRRVISELASLTKRILFVIIDLQPAVKKTEDSRNAHVLLAPSDWWVGLFTNHFEVVNTYPIYHKCGLKQKVVITCSNDTRLVNHIARFNEEVRVYDLLMGGGLLALHHKYILEKEKAVSTRD